MRKLLRFCLFAPNTLALSLTLALIAATTALAGDSSPGAERLERKGDRIEERLDQRGDRVEGRLERRGDRTDSVVGVPETTE